MLRILVPVLLTLLTPLDPPATWTSVEDDAARLSAPRSAPWVSTTPVCFRFENKGADALALPHRAPLRVYDAEGHLVFSPLSLAEGVVVPPGGAHEACWDRSSQEPSSDAMAHGAGAWTSLAGIAPPGSYVVVWRYFDPGWTAVDLAIGFDLDAPLEMS